MVAAKWGFDIQYMLTMFGWKAAIAVFVNATVLTFLFTKELTAMTKPSENGPKEDMPVWVIVTHLLFLVGVVVFAHHPAVFMGLFLFFLVTPVLTASTRTN